MKKEIKGYEGLYAIDELGNVYSLIQNASRRKRELKPEIKNGYLSVNLYKNGKCKHAYIHRLVAETFIDNSDLLPVVNHKDGNKQNNNVSNLEWCKQKENINHSWELGLQKSHGENHHSAKLTVNQVKEIRKLYVKGSKEFGTVALAKKYNVTQGTIWNVVTGKRWKEVV